MSYTCIEFRAEHEVSGAASGARRSTQRLRCGQMHLEMRDVLDRINTADHA